MTQLICLSKKKTSNKQQTHVLCSTKRQNNTTLLAYLIQRNGYRNNMGQSLSLPERRQPVLVHIANFPFTAHSFSTVASSKQIKNNGCPPSIYRTTFRKWPKLAKKKVQKIAATQKKRKKKRFNIFLAARILFAFLFNSYFWNCAMLIEGDIRTNSVQDVPYSCFQLTDCCARAIFSLPPRSSTLTYSRAQHLLSGPCTQNKNPPIARRK